MAKRDLSPFVLVLREHGEGEGTGYSMELAPLLDGGASPRAHGGGSSTSRAAPTGASPRAHGGSPTAGRSPCAHGWSPTAGQSPRAHGVSPTARRSPRAHWRTTSARRAATGPTRWALASMWRSEGATEATHRAHGRSARREAARSPPSRSRRGAAADGGAAAGARGDDPGDADGDHTAAARGRILRDMRDMLSPSPSSITLQDSSKNYGKNVRELVIPVFLAPTMKAENKKDEIWNKRQIVYGISGALGV